MSEIVTREVFSREIFSPINFHSSQKGLAKWAHLTFTAAFMRWSSIAKISDFPFFVYSDVVI